MKSKHLQIHTLRRKRTAPSEGLYIIVYKYESFFLCYKFDHFLLLRYPPARRFTLLSFQKKYKQINRNDLPIGDIQIKIGKRPRGKRKRSKNIAYGETLTVIFCSINLSSRICLTLRLSRISSASVSSLIGHRRVNRIFAPASPSAWPHRPQSPSSPSFCFAARIPTDGG